jgi:L-amino acid N-acyltransferase YncA
MGVNIRQAFDSDFLEIEQIWLEGLKVSFPNEKIGYEIKEKFQENFKNRKFPFDFWIAENSTIIGWVSILKAFSHPIKHNSVGELSIYFQKSIEKNGFGSLLLKSVFEIIKTSEVKTVFAFTNPINIASKKTLENAGMTICGETSNRLIFLKEFI